MKKIKAIVFSKTAFLLSLVVPASKSKTAADVLNLKKASPEQVERARCSQYQYVA